MVIIAALVFGTLFGLMRARGRGGNRLDMAQHAAVYALIFTLVALFFSILINRV